MSKLNLKQKLSAIQSELKAPKNQFNGFGKYNYRSAEDILEAIKPFEVKYGVTFLVDDTLVSFETLEQPLVYVNATAIILDNETDASLEVSGQALVDFEAKGMQMPQRTGAASSYAKKYALGNLLLIDDTKDPDALNNHGKGKAPKAAPKAPPAVAKKSMTAKEKTQFLKGIGEGKFASVENYLGKYAENANKKAVVDALNKAKAGGNK